MLLAPEYFRQTFNRACQQVQFDHSSCQVVGKNVNFPCSLWQLLLSPNGIQADNLYGLIYFCVLYNLALEYTQNMELWQTADLNQEGPR